MVSSPYVTATKALKKQKQEQAKAKAQKKGTSRRWATAYGEPMVSYKTSTGKIITTTARHYKAVGGVQVQRAEVMGVLKTPPPIITHEKIIEQRKEVERRHEPMRTIKPFVPVRKLTKQERIAILQSIEVSGLISRAKGMPVAGAVPTRKLSMRERYAIKQTREIERRGGVLRVAEQMTRPSSYGTQWKVDVHRMMGPIGEIAEGPRKGERVLPPQVKTASKKEMGIYEAGAVFAPTIQKPSMALPVIVGAEFAKSAVRAPYTAMKGLPKLVFEDIPTKGPFYTAVDIGKGFVAQPVRAVGTMAGLWGYGKVAGRLTTKPQYKVKVAKGYERMEIREGAKPKIYYRLYGKKEVIMKKPPKISYRVQVRGEKYTVSGLGAVGGKYVKHTGRLPKLNLYLKKAMPKDTMKSIKWVKSKALERFQTEGLAITYKRGSIPKALLRGKGAGATVTYPAWPSGAMKIPPVPSVGMGAGVSIGKFIKPSAKTYMPFVFKKARAVKLKPFPKFEPSMPFVKPHFPKMDIFKYGGLKAGLKPPKVKATSHYAPVSVAKYYDGSSFAVPSVGMGAMSMGVKMPSVSQKLEHIRMPRMKQLKTPARFYGFKVEPKQIQMTSVKRTQRDMKRAMRGTFTGMGQTIIQESGQAQQQKQIQKQMRKMMPKQIKTTSTATASAFPSFAKLGFVMPHLPSMRDTGMKMFKMPKMRMPKIPRQYIPSLTAKLFRITAPKQPEFGRLEAVSLKPIITGPRKRKRKKKYKRKRRR